MKWKIAAPSVESQQELVKLLHILTKLKISVDCMSVFSWSLLNQAKNFSSIRKTVAHSATILQTFFLLNDQKLGDISLSCI